MERAEDQSVRYLVGALLAVPADTGCLDRDGVATEPHRIRTPRTGRRRRAGLFGKSATSRAKLTGSRDSVACGRSRAGMSRAAAAQISSARTDVKCRWRTSLAAAARVAELARGSSHRRPQAAYRSASQQPVAAFRRVWSDLVSSRARRSQSSHSMWTNGMAAC